MNNIKTTLLAVAAISATAFTSIAQEQATPATDAAPATPEAPAVQQPAPKTSAVNTKFGKIKITEIATTDGVSYSLATPILPANVNPKEVVNTLIAVASSVSEKPAGKDALNAFSASISSLSLGDMGGKSVSLNVSLPNAGNPNIEVSVANTSAIAFAPEVSTAGEVKGNVVVTDERGAQTSTSVDVKATSNGVAGTVGGSNVTASAVSSSSIAQPEVAPVAVPDAQEAISASNDANNDTVGEGKGISPEA